MEDKDFRTVSESYEEINKQITWIETELKLADSKRASELRCRLQVEQRRLNSIQIKYNIPDYV